MAITSFDRRQVLKMLGLTAGLAAFPPLVKTGAMTQFCLGKQPARDSVKLTLRDYISLDKLPPLPSGDFGHQSLVKDWGMLGNDTCGDCALAGPFHAIMLWNQEAGRTVNVDTAATIKAYSTLTDYDPAQYNPLTGQNPTDRGSNVQDVSEYWRTTGLTDADGKVHKIDAYAAIEPGNFEELLYAMYLFDGVGIGLQFPREWMDAFRQGSTWEHLVSPTIEGGHYVLGCGMVSGYVVTVTWGRLQLMSQAGYEQANDETFIYLDEEKLVNGKDLEGFDLDQLVADMKDLAN